MFDVIRHSFRYLAAVLVLATLWGCATPVKQQTSYDIEIWPVLTSAVKVDPVLEAKVAALLASMTIEQKVAQMIQPELQYFSVEDMRQYGFGSFLSGGNTSPGGNKYAAPAEWLALADAMYDASMDSTENGISIPTMWGIDAIHGHNNVFSTTIFPHNIGLGAANNPDLMEEIGHATAKEILVTGIQWAFAPTVAVPRDDRWGRTYEGFSESPEIVAAYGGRLTEGLQGEVGKDFMGDNRVIATTKHFLGDGGTGGGIDRGDTRITEQELFAVHAAGYVSAIQAGAQTVMASFNSWNGQKLHGHEYLLTDVLKNRMGFDGIVVSDWNAHSAVEGCDDSHCAEAINAGIDIIMVPEHWLVFMNNTLEQVQSGQISQARIDDAVTRILRVKMRYGLFDKGRPSDGALAGQYDLLGAQAHRDIARKAVRESLVLLKNNANLLPLERKINVLVAGDGADNIGKQNGGWSLSWQGTDNTNADFPGASSIYDGIKESVEGAGGSVHLSEDGSYSQRPDIAIVVFGEDSYAEWHGDIDNLAFDPDGKKDLELLKRLKEQGIPVVSVFISGRPLWVNEELNNSDAFVAAWLPGSEGKGVAEVLFKKANGEANYDFKGKLSFSWPKSNTQFLLNHNDDDYDPLFAYGFGLTYSDIAPLPDNLSEEESIQPETDSIIDWVIPDYPIYPDR